MSSAASPVTVYRVLVTVSLVHLLNDSLQSVIPAVLPILQRNLALNYFQVGTILLVMNVTASLLQPFIGYVSDRTPRPYLLPLAMLISGTGMVGIAFSPRYEWVLLSVALVGVGSALFHPEASRVAYLASGPRRGLGQSIFQVGGNAGQALAPLMTAAIFVPLGQSGAAWFAVPAALALSLLVYIAFWYAGREQTQRHTSQSTVYGHRDERLTALIILVIIVSVRSWMYAGLQSYYPFYLIHHLGEDLKSAQFYVFLFLFAGAIGTFFGGPLADRYGKRNWMIVASLGALPLSIWIPFAEGAVAYVLLFLLGLILLSSFSVTVVYAQELWPGRIGTVSGLMIGLAFGMGGVGASALGYFADLWGLPAVIVLCSLLPAIGALGFLLPADHTLRRWEQDDRSAAEAVR